MNKLYKIVYNVLRSFSAVIFNFIIAIVGIAHFGKEDWGEFIHLQAWIIFLAFIGSYGNKDYLIRAYSTNPSRKQNYFSKNVFSRLILLILCSVLFLFFPLDMAISSCILVVLIFIYQSFDSIIIYNQKFLSQLIAESLGFTLIILGIFYISDFNILSIIYLYSFTVLVKMLILLNQIKPFLTLRDAHFSLQELKMSLPFFLIAFSGWLSTKMDFYVVNFMMPSRQISEYQLGVTSFYLLQSLSYLIVLPFNKHLYRLNTKTIKKIKAKVALISFPIVIIGSISIWCILEKLVSLNLSTYFYFIGAMASIPTFFFIIDIIMYYRFKKEKVVMKLNFILAFLNLILSVFLIKKIGLIGALTSMLIAQYIALLFYKKNVI